MAGRRQGARRGRGWDAAPSPDRPDPPWTRPDHRWASGPATDPSSARGSAPAAGKGRGAERSSDPARPDRPTRDEDAAEFAREVCLRQLAVRPRTRAELAAAMRRRGVPEDVAAAVLDRYADVGMVDDAAFARAWVSSRHHGRGLARRALSQELRQRGVDGDDARAALEALDPQTETDTARALVRRKLRSLSRVESAVAFRRLAGMLARKGYPAGVALAVVREELAADADDDHDGTCYGLEYE